MTAAIETRDLVRVFQPRRTEHRAARAPRVALDRVSLRVEPGELFGLLGPNGAGKTTLIKILVTLILPTSGSAYVSGLDVSREPHRVRERISMVSGGETSGFGLLTVREQLWMFARFYGLPSKVAKARIDELLELVGLYEDRHSRVATLSTGMRQKMNLVRGFVSDPQILFLDEPTVGLDVEAAREIRAYIRKWMSDKPGRTILLTTHYLHEADELCDRVAIIHQGKIIADDAPVTLRTRAADGSSFLLTTEPLKGWSAEGIPGVRHTETRDLDGRTELRLTLDDDAAISGVVGALAARDRKILSLQKLEPSLEDVFIQIVGRSIADADEEQHRAR